MSRPAWEFGLCLAADGEVVAAQRVPEAGDRWLYFVTSRGPLTEGEAQDVAREVTTTRRDGRSYLTVAPLGQDHLRREFQRRIDAAAGRLPETQHERGRSRVVRQPRPRLDLDAEQPHSDADGGL